MKYLIFSDIHSNLEAFRVFQEYLKSVSQCLLVYLGDIVGYGPNPKRCIQELKALNPQAILAGNHDWAVADKIAHVLFNATAFEAVEWTKKQLSLDDLAWLSNLALTHEQGGSFFVHATPIEPENFKYVLTLEQAREVFETINHQLCFIGHSHQPMVVRMYKDKITVINDLSFEIENDCRYIINVGSIGQPRDQDNRLSFVVFDGKTIEFIRFDYPLEITQQKILDSGLSTAAAEYLAKRLKQGQ